MYIVNLTKKVLGVAPSSQSSFAPSINYNMDNSAMPAASAGFDYMNAIKWGLIGLGVLWGGKKIIKMVKGGASSVVKML